MKRVDFKKVTIVNFLSVGEEPVSVEFTKGLHVITGKNKDKPDRRNAIGKSTIADSIYFAIFGETLREIKKDLIPNNLTNGKTHVELDFEVTTNNGTNEYKIIRNLSPSKAFIFKDGIDKTRDSISNTTKYIAQILSASQAIFQNCVIMTVNNAVPFMAKNKIEKRKFIEDIFGMEVFSTMLTTLRNEYNEIKREHDTELTKLDEVSKSLKNYSNQKDKLLQKRKDKKELYQSRQANNKKELEKLVEEIQNYEEINVENIQNSIDSLNERLEDCETKMSDDISQISSEKAKVKYKKEQYKKIGTDEEICPVCLRSIEEHDQDLILKEKEKLKSSIELMVESIASCLENLDELKKRKVKILSAITACHNKIAEAKVTLQKRKGTKERVSQLEEWLDELKIDLEAVESTETDFDNLIVDTKKRFDSLENTVKEYRDQISTLDIVKFVVSEEGVKSYIVNKLLELLNGKLLHYLKRLDSNSICIFNEYFEEEILNEKNKICSYFNFSGAERKSIDLACLFTFSDIRRLQGGVQYNIAIYDELFDSSFDEKGIELITEILRDRVEELDECSIVISHRKESIKAVTGDVIYLEKENGITKRVDYKEM
jgi:DNA repair exonuclease SbcCD ATPase subunit|tara:strand:- start:483 stop:2288 length:1806 start_codon:yes stop_codon:yes gene_type:complete